MNNRQETSDRKKNRSGLNSDRISDLPGNVIDKILTCLPLEDAVRTSLLSRKWRYIWLKLPQLTFDRNFCRKAISMKKSELLMTIYGVLLLHHGPILKFILSLPSLRSCHEIDRLVRYVSGINIQEVTLHIWKDEPYKLPSSLFSSLQLRHLDLRSCIFKPPSEFGGFSRLQYLQLCEVVIAADTLSSLISSCPLLERLIFESSMSLNHLEIANPSLKNVSCVGTFKSICLKNAPVVTDVSIYLKKYRNHVPEGGGAQDSVGFFGCLPFLEFLKLDGYYIKYLAAGGVPKRLPTTVSQLKSLNLYLVSFLELDEVSFVLCLIRSSPNLEKITISVCGFVMSATGHVLDLFGAQDWSGIYFNKLREVTMYRVSGLRSQLEFIKLLLDKSPELETMLIVSTSRMVVHDKELGILKELTRCITSGRSHI